MDNSTSVETHSFALVTLKERCHFLKEQLRAVDEENIKLKVQIASGNIRTDGAVSSTNMLVEQVETLKKQNCQLTSQVNILATENSNLWNRLSKLTVINKTLERRLSTISDTLDKHGLNFSISDSDLDKSSSIDSKLSRKDIEELSQRLIDSIKLEKKELERQYHQMVELHNGNSIETAHLNHDFAFGSVDSDDDNVLSVVRKHALKMNQVKQTLLHQQGLLRVAIEDMKKIKSELARKESKPKQVLTNEAATETSDDLPDIMSTSSDRRVVEINANEINVAHEDDENLCPMCGNHIPGDVKALAEHVANHFEDEFEDTFTQLP